MKRNTPLITLLTGAALGVVLLVASMMQTPVKKPAGYSSTATPTSASPATSAPAAPASSSAPASVSASPTATPYAAAPAKATYAGKSNSGGSTIDAWFSGPASSDGKVTLTGKDNATLTAAYGVGQMTGDVTAHGTDFDFGVDTVSKSSGAGLYQTTAKVGGDTVKAGWIVLDDGTQIGSLEPDSTSATPSATTAPRLDLATLTATYHGTVLHASPVSSVTGSGF